jgi:hypothetical protein
LRETRIQRASPRAAGRSRSRLQRSACRSSARARSSVLVAGHRLDELALLLRALQKGEQHEALDESKHVHGGAAGHLLVQLGGHGIVFGDGKVAVQPGEVDGAHVDGLALGRGETRRGVNGHGDTSRVGKDEVGGRRERRFLGRVGRRGWDDLAARGNGIPQQQQRVVGCCHFCLVVGLRAR